ncbi:hypothetical protein V2J09_022841, partial [Rumex salicifolius]
SITKTPLNIPATNRFDGRFFTVIRDRFSPFVSVDRPPPSTVIRHFVPLSTPSTSVDSESSPVAVSYPPMVAADELHRNWAGNTGVFFWGQEIEWRGLSWLRDYDKLQSSAVILIYIQIGCALVGSLGALYNGVLLINLSIALFALVAIESGSQRLGRTYAILLFCAILLDITWFILFSYDIWHISSEDFDILFIFSVKLTLSMQIVGFSVRLGVSHAEYRELDLDMRNSFINPSTPVAIRQISDSEDLMGGSIYDPAYYSSLFEGGLDNACLYEEHNHLIGGCDPSNAETCSLKLSMESHFTSKKDDAL